MKEITISNDIFYDKDYFQTFAKQSKYKFFAVNADTSTLVPMYQELLREVIGNDVETVFQDRAMTTAETQQIKAIFENKIDETLPKRETENTIPHRQMVFKNQKYDLDLGITCPMNRRIWDFYTIVQICEECLKENKPMYLSIE